MQMLSMATSLNMASEKFYQAIVRSNIRLLKLLGPLSKLVYDVCICGEVIMPDTTLIS